MGCQALEQAAEGNGGITVPGNVQKSRRHGTWERGLAVGLAVLC